MNNKALLVVDVQQGLFNKVMKVYESDELLDNINKLIEAFRLNNSIVVFIRHTNHSLLKENTSDWQIHPKLNSLNSDCYINKEKSNIFNEKKLMKQLTTLQITEVIIVGLVSHGCVKATCLGAVDEELVTTLISDGHSNFNKRSKEIIDETNNEMLEYKINVISTEQYLEGLTN